MTDRATGSNARSDLTRTVLAVLLIGILTGASFWILRPFCSRSSWQR